ncbi:HYD1 signature containing ADP-ribosyltransferase family protein [Streptomyces sedi]|uniref:Uncharacterized protein n=1 Tax=Streptomyces sedi TaxID=555059 RepID=A0A5C4VDL0_9ACTN|nr:HYD1 signature containing ADP-ribosyltransferase family protein [Streptomyces sedi]TNM33496.1 hypothetical protein FH715_03845 [Streptomyces sedi]
MDRDPTPGDPDEVRELADDLREFADDVGEALGKIRGMAGERAVLEWAGLSADAFRREFDGVPDNLTKLEDSYSLCAQALHTYWPKLQTAQGMADRALDRAVSAQVDLASAQSALGDATDWVGRAGDEAERLQREGERDGAEPPDEADVRAAARDQQAAESAAGAARSQVDDAEERLAAARQLALDAQEMREEAARECARDIDEASDAGIQNRRWWEKVIKWVTDNWDTLVEICKVIVAVLGVVVMIIGGPLAWVVLAAAVVVLADTLIKYAKGEAGLLDVAFAALDCIPGMKGLTTLGGLARGVRGLASTGLRGLRQGALGLGRRARGEGIPINARNSCGDPVDVATGELLMSATDVLLPGVLPLTVERHHVSGYRAGSAFGHGWSSTFDQRLVLDEYGVRFLTADGMFLLYPRPIPGEAVYPVEGPRWSLSWDGVAGSPLAVHQVETGLTLRFAPVAGRPASELPVTAITDRNGNLQQFVYDSDGFLTDVHHSGGYHLGVGTTAGRVTDIRLLSAPGRPVLMRYGYDRSGSLTDIVNSSGKPLRFRYADPTRIARWEDRNGNWYEYTYDEQGRCVHTTGPDGLLAYRYVYDSENQRTLVTDSLGHVSTFQFNDSFQLLAQTDPLGHTSQRSWDRHDRVLSLSDPLGNTLRHTYEEHGWLSAVTHPDGSTVRIERNEFGQPAEMTEANGNTWSQAFDSSGNRIALVDPQGRRTLYAYDAHGGLARIVDAEGAVTQVRCDGAGLPVAVTSPDGSVTRYERDAFGRPSRVVDPLSHEVLLEYTPEGLLSRRVDPAGGEQLWEWDGENNCVRHTDENGGVSHFTYGPFDVLTSQTDPTGARYEYRHDSQSRLVCVVAPGGKTWDYTRDANGRVVAERDMDGRAVSYTFDARGQLTARTNATGQVVAWERDALGRVAAKRVGDTVTDYRYDEAGNLVGAAGPDVELVLERDPMGRILAETVNGRTLGQRYDGRGRLVARTTPGGHTSTWQYDLEGRSARLEAADHVLSFAHDPTGRETERRVDDNASVAQVWGASGQLTAQVVNPGAARERRRSYGYRADGHLTAITDSAGGATEMALDGLGRITELRGPRHHEGYAYGAGGALAAVRVDGPAVDTQEAAVTFDGARPAAKGDLRYEYDAAGRVVLRERLRPSGRAEGWRYSWDAEDRLTEVVTPDGTRWRYRYDPVGRRSAKERLHADGSVAETTTFTWHDTTLVETTTEGADAGPTTLTWDHDALRRPISQTERRGENDRRFYAIVTDLVGTPTELLTAEGERVWASRTTVWGKKLAPTENDPVPLRFPGQYADEETGWHYNLHRHYDPETASYTAPDPLGLAPAPHHYGYVDNPHSWLDPLGLTPCRLYHYTNEDGLRGILDSKEMWPSLRAQNPKDARYGDGQYLTDIAPGTRTLGQLSYAFLRVPWAGRRFTHYVEIDVRGLDVLQAPDRPDVFIFLNDGNLDISDRIVSHGRST